MTSGRVQGGFNQYGFTVGILMLDTRFPRIAGDMPVAVAGMETEKEFTRVLLGDEMVLDVDVAREEHVRVARRLVTEHPDVGAIVLECTNMPPYTADIQRETGLAVFDIVSLVSMVHAGLAAALPPRPA